MRQWLTVCIVVEYNSLLVIIGFAAAFIISLFPKPTSARKIVRLRAAKVIDSLSDLYMDELKGFLLEAKNDDHTFDDNELETRAGIYRTKILGLVVSGPAVPFHLGLNLELNQHHRMSAGTTRASGTSAYERRFRAKLTRTLAQEAVSRAVQHFEGDDWRVGTAEQCMDAVETSECEVFGSNTFLRSAFGECFPDLEGNRA